MDDRALLTAVRADPDDDLPRLAYADWLDEQGEHLVAEFLRVQIELARTPTHENRHAQLKARCRELEPLQLEHWRQKIPSGLALGTFVRGLPLRVELPSRPLFDRLLHPEDFTDLEEVQSLFPLRIFAARLLGATLPTIARFPQQSRYPVQGDSPLERLARWPGLAGFTTLDLGTGAITAGMGDYQPGILALTHSPFARQLTTLRLSGLLLGEEAIVALGASSELTRLRSLDLRFNVPFHDRPAVLLETSLVDRLEEIDGIDLESAARMLQRPGCRLRELGISLDPHNDHPEPVDLGPLLHAPGLTRLRRLTLEFQGPGAWENRHPERNEVLPVAQILALFSLPRWTALEELTLDGLDLGDLSCMHLLTLEVTSRLLCLRLRRCRLRGEFLPHLRHLLATGSLRHLDLCFNYLTSQHAHTLACWPELSQLHSLALSGNDLHPQDAELLARSPFRPSWLYLTV